MGRFDVSLVALANQLHLPPGTEIVAVVGDAEQQIVHGRVSVVVRHPDLPDVIEGAEVPQVEPCWHEEEFVSWQGE